MNAWMAIAKFLSTGEPYVPWFIIVAMAVAIIYMYRNTYPKEISKENQEDILENQKQIIATNDKNSLTLALILEILKGFIPRGPQ